LPSSEGRQPGELAWTDFLQAMVAAGFAPEKLYGSVWLFRPVSASLRSARSINFHEPHPRSKLASVQARRIGRRLRRTYGWTYDTIVEGI